MAIDDFKVFNLDYEGKEINTALSNSLRKGNATGAGIESIDDDQFVVGQYNKVSSDYSFAVGNGIVSSRSNAFEVKRDGSVAINKTIDCNAFPENKNKTGAKGWFIASCYSNNSEENLWTIQLSDKQIPYAEIGTSNITSLPAVTNFNIFKEGQTLTFYNDYHYINKLIIVQVGSDNSLLVKPLTLNGQLALPPRSMKLYPFRYGVYISGRADGSENNIVFDDSLIDAGPSPLTFNSLTVGYNNVIGGYTSSVIGMGNRSYGQYSLTVGKDCNSSGYATLNVGTDNELHSEKTLIVGNGNTSEFNYNYVFGKKLRTTEGDQMLIGIGKADGSEIALPSKTRFAIVEGTLKLAYSSTEGLKVSNGISTNTLLASTSITVKELKAPSIGYIKVSGNIRATETGSINIGTTNTLSSKGGYLIGSTNKSTATTENCFVFGYNNTVSGAESVTIGSNNTNEYTKAMLIGSELTSSYRDQVIVGRGNATLENDIRFAVGGAVDSTNKKTVFTVDTSGNVKATGDIADKNGTTIAALLARIQVLEAKVK